MVLSRLAAVTAIGDVVQRAVLVLGSLLVATSALAAVLGGLGWWRPLVVWPLLAVMLAGLALLVRPVRPVPIGVGPALAMLAVALAAGWWAAATHNGQVLPRRDAGSNLQAALALAETGHRVLAIDPAAFGGAAVLGIPGITLASPAFYQVGSAGAPAIEPQFVIGPAAIYSLGDWIGGIGAMLVQPAWLSAFGVLGLSILAAVTVGPWWGPVAGALAALTFPMLHVARATYSEPLALVTLAAGLLGCVLAARHEDRRAALMAGLLIGGTCLVRIDGLREAMLLIPVAALGAIQERRWPRALLAGAGIGVGVSFAAGLALSREYLGSIAASLVPLVALAVALALAGAATLVAARRGMGLPDSVRRSLSAALVIAVLVIGVALTLRPLVMTVRQSAEDPGSHVVAGLQLRQGLPIDGGRTYAEQSVTWLAWWVGPIALVTALVALAWGVRRMALAWQADEVLPAWSGPLVVAAGSTLLTLYRPGITPDHPWAERRLVIAIPLVVVLVVAAAAWLWRCGPARHRRAFRILAAACVAALAVPTALASWPHRTERVERGSLSAIVSVCHALVDGDVVLAVDSRAANEWPQVVRGQCGRPALSTTTVLRRDPAALRSAVSEIAAALPAGSRLILLAADSADALTALGATPTQAVDVTVLEEPRLLIERPASLVPLTLDVWLAPAPA